MTTKSVEDIKSDLTMLVRHLRSLRSDIERTEGDKAQLAVLRKNPDGGGKIEMSFDMTEMLGDLATLLEMPAENTQAEDLKLSAQRFQHKMRAQGVKFPGD